MAQKPINGADAVSIRKWTEEHARDAERDEAIERESLSSDDIVTDVFRSWMRSQAIARGAR